ncbi:hypothetical protein TURU_084373 [Turdus rufiventris]|nr:hypothetical protein TURU_084373 [Turdus rufiventris]
MASVQSCWKLPSCPAQPMADGSEDGHAAGQTWANERWAAMKSQQETLGQIKKGLRALETLLKGPGAEVVFSVISVEVFNSKTICPQCTQHHKLEDRYGEQNEIPISHEKIVSDLLHHLDTYKSMELDGIHPRILTELAEVLTEPLSIIYQQSWSTSEVPGDWKLVKVMPIYKQGQKEDLGNYRPDLGT